jgi:hypothetical protein
VSDPGWPHEPIDPQAVHEQRIRRLEERQAEAFRYLDTLKRQVRVLRERAGLPPEPEAR